jgi:RNA polymerase sigma factor (sigma-70 family)
MTESQLIEACRRQDRRAQKILYDRYARAMYNSAYRILGGFDLASEALQDGFLQVFKHIQTFEGRSTLGAWIKKIVIRAALSTLRQQKKPFETLETHWNDSGQVDWAELQLDAEYLEKAILTLPEGYRTVFLLAEVEGYTHQEIAEMLQIAEGTSKSQLWAAKKRLRALLQDQLMERSN